jgi:hypothetical protein
MRDRKSDAHTKVIPIKPGQIRHHKDEDKTNNTPGNLEAVDRAEHTRRHNKTRPLSKLRKSLTMHKRGEKLY